MLRKTFFIIAMCLVGLSAWSMGVGNKVRVGVFQGNGGAQTCIWETIASIQLDPDMTVRTITTGDIANGVLKDLDAIIIPGGEGTTQYMNLGEENMERIRNFIRSGKGAVGICAGAYLFTDTPGYACMHINGGKAIDIEHDNRGHGISAFSLTAEGKKLFPELAKRDKSYVMYYEGPVLVKSDCIPLPYTTMAIMETDVHEEGNAPANMTNNRPFFIANEYGKGRVFSSISHPEATPGMMWMIPRMVRWTLRMPVVAYSKRVVNPDLYNREILMTKDDLRKERGYYRTFLYGSPNEKIAALDWLQACRSWDAKRWVQGLLFDNSPAVRERAARFIAETDYLPFLSDLEAACRVERDEQTKQKMVKHLEHLKALLPHK
ncbi:BPL-N domain-containing protein [uncultured Prevotella sp.]|uniref:BPL-N domain-containing protein n=1 Tax=uncultured Prevotella sp. TaxID=159272 RepID=UPI00280532C4|nr:BPL-N domain-containing protein [uncultured Prevotella sp.]